MTKLRQFLRSSARAVFNRLFFIALVFVLGCSSSTEPTFYREDIAQGIEEVCKKEYGLEVKAKLFGRTLWTYLPLEDIFTKKDKPEKYLEKFAIQQNLSELKDASLTVSYSINPVPEKEVTQEYGYTKESMEKINNVWKALRRVLFSMERRHESEPEFCAIVIADIKNGVVAEELFYYPDLKKVSYGFISWDEYQHRTVTQSRILAEAIDNRGGSFILYRDVTLKEFITSQIMQRVRLKFQKPEVEKDADIDKEVRKVAEYTLKTYGFKDFSTLELDNLATKNKILLQRKDILTGVKE